jgi:hypothetical protein
MVKKVVKRKPRAKPKPKPSSGIAQTQQVTINLTKPSTPVKRYVQVKEQPKQFLPMMPSFNINPAQPQPISDLAKVIGMLIPKTQTESTLGVSIPDKPKTPVPRKTNIGGLIDKKDVPSLGDAIKATVVEEPSKPVVDAEPIYDTTVEGEEEAVFKKPSVPTTYLKIPEPRKSASKYKPEFSGDIKKYFQKKETNLCLLKNN